MLTLPLVTASLACFPSGASASMMLDLADMVGGGTGTGTGTIGAGINPANGFLTLDFPGNFLDGTIQGDGLYNVVPDLPFVDGVFVPNGSTQLTSDSGHTFSFATDNRSFDVIENGPNDINGSSAGFRTIAGVDYTTGGRTMIGMHANKGITFDLLAIRAANPRYGLERFTAVVGDDFRDPTVLGEGASDYRVFLDGVLIAGVTDIAAEVVYDVDVLLGPDARFLTLTATDGSVNSFFADRVIYGNPQLKLVAVPEPSSLALFAVFGFSILARSVRWRRRTAARPQRRPVR